MSPFLFEKLHIQDVMLIKPRKHGDERGFFMETFRENLFQEAGIDVNFVQENHSLSEQGVLRGLHYQLNPDAQGKLVRVVSGRALDVAVDIRRGSPTYGQHITAELSADNAHLLWVPAGFAHGFLSLENDTQFLYKTTAYYAPNSERSILWSDPAIGIKWPQNITLKLSDKDRIAPTLSDAENNFDYA